MTDPAISEADIIVRTKGLSEDEVAAVVSVVRATVEEQVASQDCGDDVVSQSVSRWRRGVHEVPGPRREWR